MQQLQAPITVLCLIILIVNAPAILNWFAPVYKEPELSLEEYPINYPMEPMFENYDSIRSHIWACEDEFDLKQVYTRIVIFEGCYNDSVQFTRELLNEYCAQASMILKK